jgi:hypothetical protein
MFKLVSGDFGSVPAMQYNIIITTNSRQADEQERQTYSQVSQDKLTTRDIDCRRQQSNQQELGHGSQFHFTFKQSSFSTAHLPNLQAAQVRTPGKRLVRWSLQQNLGSTHLHIDMPSILSCLLEVCKNLLDTLTDDTWI